MNVNALHRIVNSALSEFMSWSPLSMTDINNQKNLSTSSPVHLALNIDFTVCIAPFSNVTEVVTSARRLNLPRVLRCVYLRRQTWVLHQTVRSH